MYKLSNISKEDNKDFIMLHKSIVDNIILFINNHPRIKELIKQKQEELAKEWNKNITGDKLKSYPDVQCFFGIDCLDESIKQNKWVPSTDSSLNLIVGDNHIIDSY
jgi:hypothetical protein